MLLGKRARPPMTRSTSMRGITTVDLSNVEASEPSDSSTTSSRNSSGGGDHLMRETTSHFLRICGLCQRRLSPGRDIFMYRGDTAFCSQECREQQMKQDERKEKYSSMPSTTTSKAPGKSAQ